MNVVTVADLVQELKLEVITKEISLDRKITEQMISRPGMELAGVIEYFRDSAKRRVQIIGTKEWLYKLEKKELVFYSQKIPQLLFSLKTLKFQKK